MRGDRLVTKTDGHDGSDFSHRQTIKDRYAKMASCKQQLKTVTLAIMGYSILVIGLAAAQQFARAVFLFTSTTDMFIVGALTGLFCVISEALRHSSRDESGRWPFVVLRTLSALAIISIGLVTGINESPLSDKTNSAVLFGLHGIGALLQLISVYFAVSLMSYTKESSKRA
jgi:hypothetical protein